MKHIKKGTLILFIIIIALSASFAGCDSENNQSSTAESADVTQEPTVAPKSYKIAFNSPLASLQFMKDLETGMGEGAKKISSEGNFNVQFTAADAKGSVENTINNIETFIAQGVDMIISVNTDPAMTAQLIEEAHGADIPFCVVGMTVGTEDIHVGVDDYQTEYDVALELGKWIKENLNDKGITGKVLLIENTTTATMRARTEGSIAGLDASGCTYEILQRIDVKTGTADETLPLVTDALIANSTINVFVTPNDNTAMACLEAAKQAGMNPEEYVIAGYGLETPSIPTFLSDGTPYRFSYSSPTIYAGSVIMYACIASLEGIISKNEDGTPYEILSPGFVSDAETLKKFYTKQTDGTWIENAAEMEKLFMLDERYSKILSLGK